MDILSERLSSSINTDTLLFCDYILGNSYFLLLGFDLNLVLQQGQVFSSVKKNNAHSEHHFCPILYRRLFVNVVDLILSHKPLHI